MQLGFHASLMDYSQDRMEAARGAAWGRTSMEEDLSSSSQALKSSLEISIAQQKSPNEIVLA
jgi:hypothetical protein